MLKKHNASISSIMNPFHKVKQSFIIIILKFRVDYEEREVIFEVMVVAPWKIPREPSLNVMLTVFFNYKAKQSVLIIILKFWDNCVKVFEERWTLTQRWMSIVPQRKIRIFPRLKKTRRSRSNDKVMLTFIWL